MITNLVLFGASGDVAGRFLLPALATLHASGLASGGFAIVGTAVRALTTRRSAAT